MTQVKGILFKYDKTCAIGITKRIEPQFRGAASYIIKKQSSNL